MRSEMNGNATSQYDYEPWNVKALIIGIVVLVLGISVLFVLMPQQRVLKCGIDQKGPYAKVLVSNLLGSYHNANWTGVEFHYDGVDRYTSTGFERPAHSITTTTVRPDYVPKGNLSERALSCSAWKNY
jgi:hypothetical protein